MISAEEIRYFLECARAGNLSRAAERLGITQPAVTSALRRLEHEVGAELFHRSKKGVRLTKAGEVFHQEAKALVDHWERLARTVSRAKSEVKGKYVVGCHPSVALYSLPQVLPAVLSDFPELEIELRHDLSRKVAEALIRGEIDLALVVNPVRHPDLVIKPLCRDKVSFWSAKSFKESGATPLLLHPELLQTQQMLRKLKKNFSRTITSTSLEVLGSLANEGAGVAILPGRVAALWKNLRPHHDLPTFEDEVALLFRAENRSLPAVQELGKRLEKGLR